MNFCVVIPAYNAAHTLPHCLNSVINQTYPATEIVVADDGSTDHTIKILQAYADRVRCVSIPHGGRPAVARNRGIAETKAEYIAFLDADDAWYPNKLEEFARATKRFPEAGLFYSDFVVVDENFGFLYKARCKNLGEKAYERLPFGNPICTSTAVVKRDCLRWSGVFDEDEALRGCEDWDLWIRLARKFPIVHIRKFLSEYTRNKLGMSVSRGESWLMAYNDLVNRILERDRTLDERKRRRLIASYHYGEGRQRLRLEQPEKAIAAFGKSVAGTPLWWRSWLYLAFISTGLIKRVPLRWR